MPRVLLFDIDGTLLDTRGAGLQALLDAAEEEFGIERERLPELDLAGATDGGVTRSLFADLGLELTAERQRIYLDCYLKHLARRLHHGDFAGVMLPGVRELVLALQARDVTLGLLTGNTRAGAEQKLRRFDLAEPFLDGAFGDDAVDRNHLGPIAMERMSVHVGQAVVPEEVIIIGDTVRDIACAEACGARCLAVATGVHSQERLEEKRPWRCLADLTETDAVVDLLTEGA